MKPIEIKKLYVTWANAMRQLGFSETAYTSWVRKGYIPIHSQIKIEQTTKGKLKANINK